MSDSEWGGNDRRTIINAVTWSLTGLSTAAVILRFVGRTAFGPSKLGLDDFITVVCVLIMFAAGIAISIATSAGFGRHFQDLSPAQASESLKMITVMNFFIVWAFSMPKFAIIALLQRILKLKTRVRVVLWGVAVANQCGILALSIYWFTRCRPVAKAWDPTLQGTCDDVHTLGDLGYVFSAISSFLDIFFALYPIPAIMGLKLPLQKRIAIACSLGLGIVACAVSIYKISTFPTVLKELPTDPSWAAVPLVMFADVESNILVLTASLATLGPLYRWMLKRNPLEDERGWRATASTDTQEALQAKRLRRRRDLWEIADDQSSQTGNVPLVDTRTSAQGPEGSSAGKLPPEGGIQRSVHISVSYE